MNTEEFKKYLINYFEKKEKNRLYRIFKKENDKHEYYRRRWGPSRPKNQ